MFLVGLAALVTVAGNLLMRAGVVKSGGFKLAAGALVPQLVGLARQPLFFTGAVLYVVSALIWFSVISTEQLSTAYPILVSLTFLLVTAGSVVFFAESVSLFKAFGIAIMLTGIWIVAKT